MKNDIDKIDEQIEAIQNAKKRKPNMKNKQTPVESVISTDTKKIDKIDSIVEEAPMNDDGDTKKFETVKEEENTVQEEVVESVTPVESVESVVEEQPKKKIPTIYIICGVVIVILIIVLFSLLFFKRGNSRMEKANVADLSEKEKEQIIINYGDSIKALVDYHKTKDDRLLSYKEVSQMVKLDYVVQCREAEIYEDTSIYLNKCSIDDVAVKYSYGKKIEEEPELPEGTIRIYVTSSGAYFKKPKKGIKYETYDVTISESYYGLKLLGSKSNYICYITKSTETNNYGGTYTKTIYHMVNFKTGKKALENLNYSSIIPINIGGKYDPEYAAVNIGSDDYNNQNWKIYHLDQEKSVIPDQYRIRNFGLGELSSTNGLIVVEDQSFHENNSGMMEYKTGKIVIPIIHNYCNNISKTVIQCSKYTDDDSHSENLFYDLSGNRMLQGVTVLSYNKDQYALVKDNGKVKVMSFDGKVLYDFGTLNISEREMYSFSYRDGYMFKFVNNEKPYDYDNDLPDSCITMIYYPDTKKGEVKKTYCSKIDMES